MLTQLEYQENQHQIIKPVTRDGNRFSSPGTKGGYVPDYATVKTYLPGVRASRLKTTFCLNDNSASDVDLYNFLLDETASQENTRRIMKTEGRKPKGLVEIIREGVYIWRGLRGGNVDVIFEIFPELRDKIRSTDDRDRQMDKVLENQEKLLSLSSGDSSEVYAVPRIDDLPIAFIVDTVPSGPTEARENFALGLGSLFDQDEDDEEFWS